MNLQFVPLDESFPRYLRENPERFGHLIHPGPFAALAERLYAKARATSSDIHEHLPYLHRLASTVTHVTELGTRHGVSTSAFLHARPQTLITYDIARQDNIANLEMAAQEIGV